MKFVIHGYPYIKKSNQHVVWRKNLGRAIKINTPQYDAWEKSARVQLGGQQANWPDEAIDYPVNLRMKFFVPTNGRSDLSNMYEGVQDVLVAMGILLDDRWQIVASHDGSGVQIDKSDPRVEITISRKGE